LNRKKLKQFLRFSIINGGLGLIAGGITLYILTEYVNLGDKFPELNSWLIKTLQIKDVRTDDLLSSTIACLVGYAVGFFVQRFWIFKETKHGKSSKKFVIFIAISILFLLINDTSVCLLEKNLDIGVWEAQAITTIGIAVLSYLTSVKIFAH